MAVSRFANCMSCETARRLMLATRCFHAPVPAGKRRKERLASLLSTSIRLRCDSQENLRQALWVGLARFGLFHIFFRSTSALPSRGAFSLSLIKGSLGHVLGNSLLSDLDPSLNSPPWMRVAPQSVLPSSHNCRLYQSFGLSLQRHPEIGPRARLLCLCMQ